MVRQISGSTTSLVAGSGAYGSQDGASTSASFKDLRNVAVDSSGVVYVTDGNGYRVRKISGGVVSTLATVSNGPLGVAVDSSGNIYVTDLHAVRKITSTGTVSIVAGSTSSGYVDDIGANARFQSPKGLAAGTDGNLYVADTGNDCIRKVTLSTLAVITCADVCRSYGSADGVATAAYFDSPRSIAVGPTGTIYVVDGQSTSSQDRVRKIYMG